MNTFPRASRTTQRGSFRRACVARPSSPAKPAEPLPAIVVMIPVAPSTRRITWLKESAI